MSVILRYEIHARYFTEKIFANFNLHQYMHLGNTYCSFIEKIKQRLIKVLIKMTNA